MEIFRLQKGQKIVETLTKTLTTKGLCGSIFAIGAVSWVKLKVYDLKTRAYFEKVVEGKLEVCSLTGIVAHLEDGQIAIHPHIVVTNERFETFGGHLEEAIVSATLEVIFIEGDKLQRKYDEEIGLNLLDK